MWNKRRVRFLFVFEITPTVPKYYLKIDRVKYWINLEPCGLFCGSITWFLIAFGMYTTTVITIIF